MKYDPLMQAAVDCAMFFGLSDDDVVQPDAAVAQLEALAATLQELGEEERQQLLLYIHELAKVEESESGRTARVEFLLKLGENLGLT